MVIKSIIVLVIAIGTVSCYPNDIIKPCKKTDDACIENSAKYAVKKIYAGIPDMNVEPSDPLDVGEVQGDLSTLKYTFTDTVATNFLNCDIYNVKLDIDEPLLRVNLTCPDIVIKAHYKISGQLIVLPIEGEGPIRIDIKKYVIGIVGEPKVVEGKDGHKHIMIKKYQVYGEPQIGMHYDLQNLFGGRKELGDTVLKFANENWKEVTDFVQAPLLEKVVRRLVINVNKFLKQVPLDDLYLA